MSNLKDDIQEAARSLVMSLSQKNITLDFSIESLEEIDKLLQSHSDLKRSAESVEMEPGMTGTILFLAGAYVGETFISLVPGSKWEIDDNDPQGEVSASVVFPNEAKVWPMMRVVKRFQNGEEDSIYSYGHWVIQKVLGLSDSESAINKEGSISKKEKPWWQFW